MNQKNVVLGVIGSDVHAVGNRILEEALTEAGFNVTNLGVLVSQEEFINAAVETDAAAVWVSSLYGHAEMDCKDFQNKCIEAGLTDTLLYIGGNLEVGKQDWEQTKEKFLALGFDRVYPSDTLPEEAIADLKDDLEISEQESARE